MDAISDNKIVCICSSVTIKDLKNLIEKYPNEPKEKIQFRSQAGMRCGLCLEGLSPGVERSFFEAYDSIKNK